METWAKKTGISCWGFGLPKPLIIDNGMYVSLAARLAQDDDIAYFSTWGNAFPVSREFAPATGIENVERIDDPIAFMLDGKASHVIVPDIYNNGLERLARAMDIPTFGSGQGNVLETDREHLADFLVAHDLDVINTVFLDGIDALGDYLQKHKDKFVKISTYRGDMESFHHVKWSSTEVWFDDLKRRLGPLAATIRFLVQDPILDATEIGIDTLVQHGRFALPTVLGVEQKDAAYFGCVVADYPEAFAPIVAALSAYFKETDYNCFFSNEMRINKHGIFMTDATCRIPSPPGGVMMNAIRNLSKVILKQEKPDYGEAEYLCEIVLKSDWVADHWLQVTYPEDQNYSFHNYCILDGKTWIIPHDSKYVEFGSALGWGADAESAKEMCVEAAKAIEGFQVVFDASELDKAEEEITDSGLWSPD